MNDIITLFMSIFEWTSLLLFPIVFLGYHYRKYMKSILMIAGIMSVLSIVLRMTSLPIVVIILIQMITIILLVKWLFRAKNLETLVITSMGYGFYVFTQMLFVEIFVRLLEYDYFQILFNITGKTIIQIVNFIFVFSLCFAIHYSKYQLNELRRCIKNPSIAKRYKKTIIIISILTYIFTWLIIFLMVTVESAYKHTAVLLISIVMFMILTFFLILHIQFQKRRIMEAKKFFIDQEDQVSSLLGKFKEDDQKHFQAIVKLTEHQAPHLIQEYIIKNQLDREPEPINLHAGLPLLQDELLYAFLINKRKAAGLFGISIEVSEQMKENIPVTLQQIRYISAIFDDLIYLLYKAPATVEKTIHFHIEVMDSEFISFTISSALNIDRQLHTSLNLFDALLQFEQLGSITHTELQPVKLTVRVPVP